MWVVLYYYVFVIEQRREINEAHILLISETYAELLAFKLTCLFICMALPVAALSYAIFYMPQDLLFKDSEI
jgi:hypothetical protein